MKNIIAIALLGLASASFGQSLSKLNQSVALVQGHGAAPEPSTAALARGIMSKTGDVLANGITGTLALAANTTIGGSSVVALGTITSTSATAFTVGANGATNPGFNIDLSSTTPQTGLNIKPAVAGSGVAVKVISSGTNENLTFDAKGSGTVTINSIATGPTIVPKLRAVQENTVYTSDGAITLTSGIAFVEKTSAAAMTIAAPSSQDGTRITIIGNTDFAHVVTFTGGTLLDGTTGANTTATMAAFKGASITVVARGTKWLVESFNACTIAP